VHDGDIVAAHGGHVDVDSADGRGTTFTVHLPRDRPGA
jgi:signal transduction histidine kinase